MTEKLEESLASEWLPEYWSASTELRWVHPPKEDDAPPYLQQKWQSNLGNVEWREIPSVNEAP